MTKIAQFIRRRYMKTENAADLCPARAREGELIISPKRQND